MSAPDTFDNLVQTIDSSERKSMLESIQAHSKASQSKNQAKDDDNTEIDLAVKLNSESFLLKFWLLIKSLFSGTSQEILYNDLLISRKSKALGRSFPELYDHRSGMLMNGFYENISNLRLATDFFKPSINQFADDPGESYVFLGKLICPYLEEEISTEADPYSIPFDREITSELRLSLLRKLEDVLGEIDPKDKARLYDAAQTFEWLKQITTLPYERIMSRFSAISEGMFTCPIANISTDLETIAKFFSQAKTVSSEVIQTIFHNEYGRQKTENGNETSVSESVLNEFKDKCNLQISVINKFSSNIPIKMITQVSANNATWVPESLPGAEDWFIKFKNQWKKIFDQRWESWLYDRRKNQVTKKVTDLLGGTELPLLPNRPWTDVWGGIPFSRDYTMGFLRAFYTKIYPPIQDQLKTLILEGEFILKENQTDCTDGANEFSRQMVAVTKITNNFDPQGVWGTAIYNLASEKIRTIQSQSRMQTLFLSMETECNLEASKFGSNCRLMISFFDGILRTKTNARFDSIANLKTIKGKDNAQFMESLAATRANLDLALSALKEIETIEKTTSIPD